MIDFSNAFFRSLIYIKSSNRSRAGPCGTSQRTGFIEEVNPDFETICFLFVKKDQNDWFSLPLMQ